MHKDFSQFIELLNSNKVKYVVIGGYAVSFYAIPRYTKDLDVLIETSPANVHKLLKTIDAFGLSSLNLTVADFSYPNTMIQFGYEPVRIDILTSIKGVCWHQIWENKYTACFGLSKINFIGLEELIKNKKATHRKLDLLDAVNLMKTKRKLARS